MTRHGDASRPPSPSPSGTAGSVIAWHLLTDNHDYQVLGGDYVARRNDAETRKRYLIRQLEALGQRVTIEPTA
jgi:hypothetical protein